MIGLGSELKVAAEQHELVDGSKMEESEFSDIADMLLRHAEKRLALPPQHLLIMRGSSSGLLTPVSGGGIAAAVALTPSSTCKDIGALPSCANNHVEDCGECRQECDDCKDEGQSLNFPIVGKSRDRE